MSNRIVPAIYDLAQCVVIDESGEYSGLSNVVQGYPLTINGATISTSETLYQSCRFPQHPSVQQLIIDETDGIAAKARSRQYVELTRSDWNDVRVPIMRWCLQVKLLQHWSSLGPLLRATDDRAIVEVSDTDDFWGVVPRGDASFYGASVLGKLLMELRESLVSHDPGTLYVAALPPVLNFTLLGKVIERIEVLI